jgi:hypothetical protein
MLNSAQLWRKASKDASRDLAMQPCGRLPLWVFLSAPGTSQRGDFSVNFRRDDMLVPRLWDSW